MEKTTSEAVMMCERFNGLERYDDVQALIDHVRQEERQKAGQDAKRWRWFRQFSGRAQDMPDMPEPETPEQADAIIDAAIREDE